MCEPSSTTGDEDRPDRAAETNFTFVDDFGTNTTEGAPATGARRYRARVLP